MFDALILQTNHACVFKNSAQSVNIERIKRINGGRKQRSLHFSTDQSRIPLTEIMKFVHYRGVTKSQEQCPTYYRFALSKFFTRLFC